MKLFQMFTLVLLLAGCASAPTPPVAMPPPVRPSADRGIENAKKFSGLVESWGNAAPVSSTLSIWIQEIGSANYVLFQIRANLDTYRFALSREQIVGLIDALNVYQMTARETTGEQTTAIGWLYRANIKMKRLGDAAEDDRFIVNVERAASSAAVLSLTFDSWLLSFGGPKSPAERVYKEVALTSEEASRLCGVLREFESQL